MARWYLKPSDRGGVTVVTLEGRLVFLYALVPVLYLGLDYPQFAFILLSCVTPKAGKDRHVSANHCL